MSDDAGLAVFATIGAIVLGIVAGAWWLWIPPGGWQNHAAPTHPTGTDT